MMLTATDRAKKVLAVAAQRARSRGQQRPPAENVLLSILDEGGGVACAVLHALKFDPAALARDLEARLQAQPAITEPGGLGHGYVGTEHLLIAMTRTEGESTAQALASYGVTPAIAAATTARLLGRQIT